MRARTLILTVTAMGSVAAALIASLVIGRIESPALGSQRAIVSITQQNPLKNPHSLRHSYVTQLLQSFDLRITVDHVPVMFPGITNIASPLPQSFDLLITIDPVPVLEDSDLKIDIAISKIAFPEPEGSVAIRLETESFKVLPSDVITLKLAAGNSASYIATPKGKGDKKLRVYAKYINVADTNNSGAGAIFEAAAAPGVIHPRLGISALTQIPIHVPELDVEKIISIQVLERPNFLGLTKELLSIVQIISAFLGIPSLLLLLAARRLDSKKSKGVS